MATMLRQSSSQFLVPKMSPLRQHPVSPPPRAKSPDATKTIFLNHPSARLSSSPASSPRIVDATPVRRGSVHPAMSETMEKGLEPGADFFDDDSSDSAWEDSEGDVTQTFSEVEGLEHRGLKQMDKEEHELRGRSRERSVITALPPLPAHDSGLGIEDDEHVSSPIVVSGTKKAREMSLRRLGKDKVRLIHTLSTSGTPRRSVGSNNSDPALTPTELPNPLPNPQAGEESAGTLRSHSFKKRHRRNTSESVIADSILDAHVRTMRALESLSPSASLSHSITRIPNQASITNDRRITHIPVPATEHQRPPYLPDHFIKTPYPFTAKKEFPKPKSRPRRHGVDGDHRRDTLEDVQRDSDSEDDREQAYNDRKGKHILGMLMPSEGMYDLRSRLERNRDAQGAVRSPSGSKNANAESVVWLTLQRGTRREHHAVEASKKNFCLNIPCTLTTSSPERTGKRARHSTEIDFDDKFFAEQLSAGYRSLAGNWLIRTFSARTLTSIQLARSSVWNGNSTQQDDCHATYGLLASGDGIPSMAADSQSPFTETALMRLYRRPATGKARYTWVHWARRVAASNRHSTSQASSFPSYEKRVSPRRAHSLNSPHKQLVSQNSQQDLSLSDVTASLTMPPSSQPDTITTIQFIHALSPTRILTALALMLALSVASALLWIFLGTAGTGWRTGVERQRSERVGCGMAVGILALLLEGVVFGAWVWVS